MAKLLRFFTSVFLTSFDEPLLLKEATCNYIGKVGLSTAENNFCFLWLLNIRKLSGQNSCHEVLTYYRTRHHLKTLIDAMQRRLTLFLSVLFAVSLTLS